MFTQRIASTLGLFVSGADSERRVRSNLASSPVLLVLDNAEIFEEAVDQEKTRISSFLSDIALTPGVAVILTSRTRHNARGNRWVSFNIPPLDEVSARQYFRAIYSGEMQECRHRRTFG
ncbi:hypothetical protein JVU11DRAFT_10369 [Chiua virens]|nr:hypothetical protein JVU11DRAFT_10369 [Chiua virens]